MLCTTKPTADQVSDFLEEQKDSKLTYSLIKGTLEHNTKEEFLKDERFKEFDLDHHRLKLGQGESIYNKAVEGLKAWKQFNQEWVELHFPGTPIVVGSDIAICARSMALWTMSACRIVYTLEEANDSIKRFGFAYGTLETHVESGEERFLIEWNISTNDVFFDILAFSQPQSWFTKVAYPVARYFQNCFASGALESLFNWVNATDLFSNQHGKQEIQLV